MNDACAMCDPYGVCEDPKCTHGVNLPAGSATNNTLSAVPLRGRCRSVVVQNRTKCVFTAEVLVDQVSGQEDYVFRVVIREGKP